MAEGRAVLVTGSTGGIGTATVGLLRRQRFTVYTKARGRADFGPKMHVMPLDVADPESVAAAAKRIASEVDGLWTVINNAGVIVQGPLELVPAEPRSRCPNCHYMTHHLRFDLCPECGSRMEIEQPEPTTTRSGHWSLASRAPIPRAAG